MTETVTCLTLSLTVFFCQIFVKSLLNLSAILNCQFFFALVSISTATVKYVFLHMAIKLTRKTDNLLSKGTQGQIMKLQYKARKLNNKLVYVWFQSWLLSCHSNGVWTCCALYGPASQSPGLCPDIQL